MSDNHELQLSTDINVISFQIKQYQQTATKSFWEIGRRIKWVQDHDLAHGKYQQWLDSIGISRSTADRLKTIAAKLPYKDEYKGKGWRLLSEIAKLPASEREKPHQLADGTTKTPSEMTTREAEQLRKQLAASQKQIKELKHQAKQPPQVVTKEVVPEDYEELKKQAAESKSLKEMVEMMQQRGASLQKKITRLEQEKQAAANDSSRVHQLEQEIKNLTEQNLRTSQQTKAIKNVNSYLDHADELMTKYLAPLSVSFSIEQLRHQPEIVDAIKSTVDRLTGITNQLNKQINARNTIEGQVINHE